MTLVLQIENYPALENGSPVRFTVPEQGAQIGRSASMDWVLPDPTRHISSHHFDIMVQSGAFYLRDVSTNGTYLHATRERVNGFHQLQNGERFQVGSFLICAAIEDRTQAAADQTVFMAQPVHAAPPSAPVAPPVHIPEPEPIPAPQAAPATPPDPRPAHVPMPDPVPVQAQSPEPVAAPPPEPSPPHDPFLAENPFLDDLIPELEAAPIFAPEPEPEPEPALVPEPVQEALADLDPIPELIPEDAFLPDFLDPIEPDLEPDPEPEETPKKRDYSRIFAEVSKPALQRPPQADQTGFDDPTPLQAPPSVQIPDFDFADEDLSAPSIPPSRMSDVETTGQLSLPPHEFLALEMAAKAQDASTSEAGSTPNAPDNAILKAFCRGAGLPQDSTGTAQAEALAEALGRSVQVAATEIKLMLDARASTKQFTRGGARTMRKAKDSNPLKFLPDSEQALEVMFLTPRDGYQDGPEALQEALRDLRLHQTALFAAIQPALIAMMQGLSPDEIEVETEGGLMSGSGRSWDRFKTLYAERTEGYDNGLLDVFLTHFAHAYGEMISDEDA